jgi:hypothetical protein
MKTPLYSDGKGTTVETVTLSDVPAPSRYGDPDGDGQYMIVRISGRIMEYIPAWRFTKDPKVLERWCKLADLHEVPSIPKSRH